MKCRHSPQKFFLVKVSLSGTKNYYIYFIIIFSISVDKVNETQLKDEPKQKSVHESDTVTKANSESESLIIFCLFNF